MLQAVEGLRMSSSPDKTDARSMSDILASIRKIMAQDPESGGPAVVKPPANGAEGGLRAGTRVPVGDAAAEPAHREQPKPTAAAPAPAPAPVSSAPTPAAKPAMGPDAAPAPRAPAKPAADEPVSLDEFLALAAPAGTPVTPRAPMVAKAASDAITTPTAPASPAARADAEGTAGAPAPSSDGALDVRFLRPRPFDEGKGHGMQEPAFGTAPAARPTNAPQGPSLSTPRPAGPGTPAPKADAPRPDTPAATSAPASASGQAPINKDAGPVPARGAAPPAPKMLGDLGSVVPSRFDSQTDGAPRRLGGLADANDRFSPVSPPSPAMRPAPAPDQASAAEPEIPGADALRRLIAGVVPPSAMASSVRAPAPNPDDVRTEVVVPAQAKAPAAKSVEPAPAAKTNEPAPAAKSAEPAPAAKSAESTHATRLIGPAPAARSIDTAPAAKSPDAAPPPKPADLAPTAKAAPAQPAPPAAVSAAAPTPAAMPPPKPAAAAPSASPVASPLPGGRTMDETVVELLRPLLRDWLDANMPRLIEPALKAEIEALRGVMSKGKTD
jgi:cell pole-organizing protein PopZ